MSSIVMGDLPASRELDPEALAAVRGGNSWLAGLGPVANVNVGVTQNIVQLQHIEVNALNNVGVIGAGFGPFAPGCEPDPGCKPGRRVLSAPSKGGLRASIAISSEGKARASP